MAKLSITVSCIAFYYCVLHPCWAVVHSLQHLKVASLSVGINFINNNRKFWPFFSYLLIRQLPALFFRKPRIHDTVLFRLIEVALQDDFGLLFGVEFSPELLYELLGVRELAAKTQLVPFIILMCSTSFSVSDSLPRRPSWYLLVFYHIII